MTSRDAPSASTSEESKGLTPEIGELFRQPTTLDAKHASKALESSERFRSRPSQKSRKVKPSWHQLTQFREAFDLVDRDLNGAVTAEELQETLQDLGKKCTIEETRRIVSAFDADADGEISFPEFCDVLLSIADTLDFKEEERVTFQKFDADSDGTIGADDLRQAFARLGEELSDRDIEDMLQIGDLNKDGEITFEDFSKMEHLILENAHMLAW